jgi:hypothetical protein
MHFFLCYKQSILEQKSEKEEKQSLIRLTPVEEHSRRRENTHEINAFS